MATRFTLDADLVAEDLRRDPIEVEIPGLGVFTFPGVMPAMAVVRLSRWVESGMSRSDDLSAEQAVVLLGDFVPDSILAEWGRLGFDPFANGDTVEQLVTVLLGEYTARQGLIDSTMPEGKATAATTPPPFSGSGPSSSPTPDGSTGSPFPLI